MDIVLFTLSFPYGNQETFIEEELKYLSEHFNTVHILPREKYEKKRPIPQNVKISDCRTLDGLNKPGLAEFFIYIKPLVRAYLYSFFNSIKPLNYVVYYKSLIHYAIADLRNYKVIREYILKNNLRDAIFYDYWFVDATLSLSFLKKERIISKLICRAHGFDLYDERQYERIVSFRPFKIKYVDKVYTISQQGRDYLKSRIIQSYHNKIETSYLGIKSYFNSKKKSRMRNKYLVVSCSNIIPVKRVDRIAKELIDSNLPIHWIHFGDGYERKNLELYLKNVKRKEFSFNLMGNLPNKEILNFYAKNEIDLFINLSESEGLPVSIMEAISFGIPVLAPDINGIPEMINDKNGILIDPSLIAQEIQKAIIKILEESPFEKKEIIDSFVNKFDAAKNYNSFIVSIKNTFEIK